jgi:hypothetical protein
MASGAARGKPGRTDMRRRRHFTAPPPPPPPGFMWWFWKLVPIEVVEQQAQFTMGNHDERSRAQRDRANGDTLTGPARHYHSPRTAAPAAPGGRPATTALRRFQRRRHKMLERLRARLSRSPQRVMIMVDHPPVSSAPTLLRTGAGVHRHCLRRRTRPSRSTGLLCLHAAMGTRSPPRRNRDR